MKKLSLLLALLLIFLIGCTPQVDNTLTTTVETQTKEIATLKDQNLKLTEEVATLKAMIPEAPAASPPSLLSTALTVITLLKNDDMMGLAPYVHPTLGLRFSPYSYIDMANDQVFTAAQIPGLLADPTVYTWGSFDGSGDPIQLTPAAYFADFVYDEDYANPHMIGNNTIIGTGNTLNNLVTVYPTASFVEFHFTGFDPQYSGMDWSSLRLIFENVGGNWLLIGIEHDAWTI